MNILYINDRNAYVSFEETEGDEPFDVRDIVKRATTVKTGRDFIEFLLATPGSFFKWHAMPIPARNGFVTMDELVSKYPRYVFPESYEELVDRYYPDIEVLDEVAIKSGAIGTYTEEHEEEPGLLEGLGIDSTKGVLNPPSLRSIHLPEFESFIQNIQLLERYAAIANGEVAPYKFRRIDFGCKADIQFIDTQLWGYRDYAVGFGQNTTCKELFTRDEWLEVSRVLTPRGYGHYIVPPKMMPDGTPELPFHLVIPDNWPDTTHPMAQICTYPKSWTNQQIARDIFLFFMKVIFEDEDEAFLNHPFVVTYEDGGFHVKDNIAAIAACYREVAYLAEAKTIHVCAHCGHPLLADRSRGNEAMYCSRSCNTMASAARRERVYALAASGVPVEEAIARIGSRYVRSIRRWYDESQRLLD